LRGASLGERPLSHDRPCETSWWCAPDIHHRMLAPGLVEAAPAPGKVPVERGRRDLEAFGHVLHRNRGILQERTGGLLVRCSEGGAPPAPAPPCTTPAEAAPA